MSAQYAGDPGSIPGGAFSVPRCVARAPRCPLTTRRIARCKLHAPVRGSSRSLHAVSLHAAVPVMGSSVTAWLGSLHAVSLHAPVRGLHAVSLHAAVPVMRASATVSLRSLHAVSPHAPVRAASPRSLRAALLHAPVRGSLRSLRAVSLHAPARGLRAVSLHAAVPVMRARVTVSLRSLHVVSLAGSCARVGSRLAVTNLRGFAPLLLARLQDPAPHQATGIALQALLLAPGAIAPPRGGPSVFLASKGARVSARALPMSLP